MNDQQFINAYVRILNDTLNEAINKNLVLQAQLEVSKQVANHTAELEAKVKELSALSSDKNALQNQLNDLNKQLEAAKKTASSSTELDAKVKQLSSDNSSLQTQLNNTKVQLEQINSQLNNKNTHVETFKRELIDARNVIKNNAVEHQTQIAALKAEYQTKLDASIKEVGLLKTEIAELKSRKAKREKKAAFDTVIDNVFNAVENTQILVNDTF